MSRGTDVGEHGGGYGSWESRRCRTRWISSAGGETSDDGAYFSGQGQTGCDPPSCPKAPAAVGADIMVGPAHSRDEGAAAAIPSRQGPTWNADRKGGTVQKILYLTRGEKDKAKATLSRLKALDPGLAGELRLILERLR